MAPLWQLPATELAGLVRCREISAREAVQAALDRLDEVNGTINAVVDHRPEEALAAADAIDARLSDGEVGVAKANSPAVDNLLKAGVVMIGRTNVPAFCRYGNDRVGRDMLWLRGFHFHGAAHTQPTQTIN